MGRRTGGRRTGSRSCPHDLAFCGTSPCSLVPYPPASMAAHSSALQRHRYACQSALLAPYSTRLGVLHKMKPFSKIISPLPCQI